MMTLLALIGLACQDGTEPDDSGLPPGVFAAHISSHSDGDSVLEGYRVGLAGQVNDPDGVNSDVAVTWTIDEFEECPETTAADDGSTSCDVYLEAGERAIVLEARAVDGETIQASIILDVQATEAPTASITEPLDGATVTNEPGVYMQGLVTDAEDGPSALLTTWSSSLQGPLVGSSEPGADGSTEALVVLDLGEHVLTLDVIDATGKSGTDAVTVTVE